MHPNHPVPLTIADNTTSDTSKVMHDTHTEDIRVFREVMGVNQTLIQ